MNVGQPPSLDPQEILDTREGPFLEKWAQHHIESCKPTLLRVLQKSQTLPAPPEDSWLGRVDAKTKPFETSQQIRVFAQVATDNLREVNTVLQSRLPMFALYSMIRSAMEASSLALWILDAKSEDLAASKTLRVYRQNIESDRTLWKTVVGRYSGDHSTLSAVAEEKHEALKGINHSGFEVAVLSTSVIEVTDRKHPSTTSGMDIFSGLEVWRMCSAVTHANQISLLNIMERHPDAPVGEAVNRTSRLSIVGSAYSTALHRTNILIDRFIGRSAPRRKGR